MNLGGSPESSRFAQRYLDKIVQLPVSLPILPVNDAEAYIGLLLARHETSDDEYDALVAHASTRRKAGKAALLAEMDDLPKPVADDMLRLAAQLVNGLRSDRVVNPREIKRFLNAFQVRARVAGVRGVELGADILAKLLLLEDRFPTDFETLVKATDTERGTLLTAWQGWTKGGGQRPEGVSEESRDWAAAEPQLIEQYKQTRGPHEAPFRYLPAGEHPDRICHCPWLYGAHRRHRKGPRRPTHIRKVERKTEC